MLKRTEVLASKRFTVRRFESRIVSKIDTEHSFCLLPYFAASILICHAMAQEFWQLENSSIFYSLRALRFLTNNRLRWEPERQIHWNWNSKYAKAFRYSKFIEIDICADCTWCKYLKTRHRANKWLRRTWYYLRVPGSQITIWCWFSIDARQCMVRWRTNQRYGVLWRFRFTNSKPAAIRKWSNWWWWR